MGQAVPVGAAMYGPAIGGFVPFSTVDWPGMLAAVVFVSGCPWRCSYCHNPHLQSRNGVQDWGALSSFLQRRRGLLDGVVFSGGEPLSEPALQAMVEEVKAMGFKVALHTAGIYPKRFAAVLPLLDWVGFDVKADWCDPASHNKLTGRENSQLGPTACLDALLATNCAFECRTTWSPDWLSEIALLDLATALALRGVQNYAVQNYRSAPDRPPTAQLSDAAQAELAEMFAVFSYR